jgi:hypothetical protein
MDTRHGRCLGCRSLPGRAIKRHQATRAGCSRASSANERGGRRALICLPAGVQSLAGGSQLEVEPSLFARIFDFCRALLLYWWLLVPGGVLVVEPMIETFVPQSWKDPVDRRWPKETRHKIFRWASAAALLIASFLAFDDVSTRNRALQKEAHQATGERDEARHQRDINVSPALDAERLARLNLEEKLAPRLISKGGKETLRTKLSIFKGTSVDILIYGGGSSDALPLADAINEVLQSAGWNVRTRSPIGSVRWVKGVLVAIRSGSDSTVAGRAAQLIDALNAVGIETGVYEQFSGDACPGQPCRAAVGTRQGRFYQDDDWQQTISTCNMISASFNSRPKNVRVLPVIISELELGHIGIWRARR